MSTGNILLTNAIIGASSSELHVSRAKTHWPISRNNTRYHNVLQDWHG